MFQFMCCFYVTFCFYDIYRSVTCNVMKYFAPWHVPAHMFHVTYHSWYVLTHYMFFCRHVNLSTTCVVSWHVHTVSWHVLFHELYCLMTCNGPWHELFNYLYWSTTYTYCSTTYSVSDTYCFITCIVSCQVLVHCIYCFLTCIPWRVLFIGIHCFMA